MKRVLVVDDALFMRHMIKMILDNNRFQVVGEAENGLEAAQKYNELRPDLVTMDITMPEVDGIGAVKLIKKMDPQAKIVMISAMGQERFVKDAILAGASGFLVKPFSEEKVVQVLNAL
ncbi:MAG: response regulator [Heliobacteriaceae bacterium]|nr:response regulator [Heliobacteriaceae bacterium]MDD4587261.1 response regulator [Heliobacteriaceae bacterium]